MEDVILMAAISVAAFLITLTRVVGWDWITRHASLVDVTFTIGLGVLFYGTLTGTLIAVLGGLFMALVFTINAKLERATQRVRSIRNR